MFPNSNKFVPALPYTYAEPDAPMYPYERQPKLLEVPVFGASQERAVVNNSESIIESFSCLVIF